MNSRCEHFILPTYLQWNGCEVPKFDKLTARFWLNGLLFISRPTTYSFCNFQLLSKERKTLIQVPTNNSPNQWINLQLNSGRLLQLWIVMMYYIHCAFHYVSENGYINLHKRKITFHYSSRNTPRTQVTVRQKN